jgi:hypothetical protein
LRGGLRAKSRQLLLLFPIFSELFSLRLAGQGGILPAVCPMV